MTVTALEHIVFVLGAAVEKDAISKYELRHTLNEILGELDNARYVLRVYKTGEEPASLHALNDKISKRFTHVLFPDGISQGEE